MANVTSIPLDPSFLFNVARNQVGGHQLIIKFGRNADIDVLGAPEDLWDGGGVYTGFPTTAETVQVFSSSANDTAAGSGARTVQLIGLDASYNPITETVTLNGTTPVVTTKSFLRVTLPRVTTSGGSNTAFNAGTITVRQSITTANVFSVMPIGTNQSAIAIYTIPANKTGYLLNFNCGIASAGTSRSDMSIWIKNFNAAPRLTHGLVVADVNTHTSFDYTGGLMLPAKTDIALRITTVSSNNTDVYGGFSLLLVDDI